METKDLSQELQERLKGAKTQEDVLAIAEEEGMELLDEQLEGVAGGVCALCRKEFC